MNTLFLPCGGEANFDTSSGISYRCEHCNAVVGSVGMPRSCKEESDKWDAYEKAMMWKWDYQKGEPVCL
jgi:hypothetical protein